MQSLLNSKVLMYKTRMIHITLIIKRKKKSETLNMLSSKGFKFLEHTADEYIMAYGVSLEGAFESAALAMFEIMTDTKTIEPKDEESTEVEAEDEVALLYSWLESLLIKFDVEGKLYSRFNINKIKRTEEGFSLEATIWGETYDQNKHPSRTEIKAITYHRMEIVKEKSKTIVKFILDI